MTMPDLGSCPPSARIKWARCTECDSPMASSGDVCTGRERHRVPARPQVYATHTNTIANLNAMHEHGIRVLVGPDQLSQFRGLPDLAWAVDNGAWGCFTQGKEWDHGRFLAVLDRWGRDADWCVVPDIVAGGLESLALSEEWLPTVLGHCELALIAVQDGMSSDDVRPLLGPSVGIFVGGSTEWKWRTVPTWAQLAAEVGCHLHVGRVNSARRIRWCASLGVDSVDGTSCSVWSSTAPRIGNAARMPVEGLLFG